MIELGMLWSGLIGLVVALPAFAGRKFGTLPRSLPSLSLNRLSAGHLAVLRAPARSWRRASDGTQVRVVWEERGHQRLSVLSRAIVPRLLHPVRELCVREEPPSHLIVRLSSRLSLSMGRPLSASPAGAIVTLLHGSALIRPQNPARCLLMYNTFDEGLYRSTYVSFLQIELFVSTRSTAVAKRWLPSHTRLKVILQPCAMELQKRSVSEYHNINATLYIKFTLSYRRCFCKILLVAVIPIVVDGSKLPRAASTGVL